MKFKYHRENYNIDKICPLWVDHQVAELVKPNTTILEVGCATGYIGKFLKEKRNCKVYGIEIDRKAAEIANPHYEKLIIGDIENEQTLNQISEKFDFILCMNILEHLKNPRKVLMSLKRFIKSKGYLIVCLPNVAHWSIRLKLLFGDFGCGEGVFGTDHGKGIMDDTHLRFFTLKTIKELLGTAGYKIEYYSFDPDKGIPKFHGLILRLPGGWKLLKRLYSIWPTFFGFQFIFKVKPI